MYIKMGVGPSKIVDRLYLGSIRDGTDKKKLTGSNITHILSLLSKKQLETGEGKQEEQLNISISLYSVSIYKKWEPIFILHKNRIKSIPCQKKKDKFTEQVGSSNFHRLLITLDDKSQSDISAHFRQTSAFIHKSLFRDKGVVLARFHFKFKWLTVRHTTSLIILNCALKLMNPLRSPLYDGKISKCFRCCRLFMHCDRITVDWGVKW